MSDIKYNSCSGTDIQKLSVVYANGTSQISTSTTGIGIGGGQGGFGIGSGHAKTSGTQVTALAQRAAPPRKMPLLFALITIAFVWFVTMSATASTTFSFLVAALFLYPAYLCYRYNRTTYLTRLEQWQRSWMCHRCGNIFAH